MGYNMYMALIMGINVYGSGSETWLAGQFLIYDMIFPGFIQHLFIFYREF